MKIDLEIRPPEIPDYIYIKQSPALRQDGFKPNLGAIPIKELTEVQAVEYGEVMKQAFIDHWKSKQL